MTRSIDRRQLLAIVVALMCLTAVTGSAAAAGDNLVVGSQHSTDTEFNNAQTLDNVTVEGTGASARVELGNVSTTTEGTTATRPDDDGSSSVSTREGVEINPNTDLDGVKVKISSNVAGASTVYVTDTSGSVLDSASISGAGDVVNLSASLQAGTDYYVVVDDGGNSYTRGYYGSPSFPYTSGDVDITRGVYNDTKTTTGNAFNIKSVTALNPTSEKANEGTYIHNHSISESEGAAVNLTLNNATATVTISEEGSGTVLNQTTFSTTGNHTLTWTTSSADNIKTNVTFEKTGSNPTARMDDESILFDDRSPGVDNATATPSGNKTISNTPVELSINVSDGDFGTAQGEELTVRFYAGNGTKIDTDTLSSNGTAVGTWSSPPGGVREWYVVVEDKYGETTTSDTFKFKAPATLEIRNESDPDQFVKNATVEVQFFASDTVVERTSSDGTIDLSGLPTDEKIVVVAQAGDHYTRHIILDNIYEQNTIYLLNKSQSAVDVTFENADESGTFPPESSEVIVEKALTINGTTSYKVIAADEFGVSGFTTTLEKDQRYRLRVRNDEGDVRILGSYTAASSETVPLKPVASGVELNSSARYNAIGYYENVTTDSGYQERVVFEFADGENSTTNLVVEIYEQGNQSNVLSKTTVDGPLGSTIISEPLNANQSNKTWVIDWSADRNNKKIGGEVIVGPHINQQLTVLSGWIQEAIAILLVIMTAGLFSQLNRETGAVTTSMVGGGFWYIGWLPAEAGGAIILGLGIAVAYKMSTGGAS